MVLDPKNINYTTTDIAKPQELPPNADDKTRNEIFMQNFRSIFDRLNRLEQKIIDLTNKVG